MDFKQKVSEVVEKVEEAVGIKPEGAVEEVKEEVANESESTPIVEDRSAFNCAACKGEGLKNGNQQDALCPECKGLGKVG